MKRQAEGTQERETTTKRTKRGYTRPYVRTRPDLTEWKYVDWNSGQVIISNAGSVTCISGPSQGGGTNQRIGSKYTLRTVEYRLGVFPQAGIFTQFDQLVTYMLVLDKAPGGVIATVSQILQEVNTLSPRNIWNRSRFKILLHKTVYVNEKGDSNDGFTDKGYLRIGGRKGAVVTASSATGAGIGGINVNALLWVILTSVDVAANQAAYQVYTRVRFVDI